MESIGCSFTSLSLPQFRANSFSIQELLFGPRRRPPSPIVHASVSQSFPASSRFPEQRKSTSLSASGTLMANSAPSRSGVYTVGDFMTRREELHVVKPTTSVDEGGGRTDPSMFPEVDSSWKTFNEVQRLLSKTNGKVIGDLMTPAPLVVRETTNLEDAARLLLKTKYRRLPVVDAKGKLVGIITRGNVVRAALQMKHAQEN